MKNRILLSLLFTYLMLQIITCSSEQDTTTRICLPDPITKMVNSINITIDPKVELISIIQYISIYGEKLGFLLNNSEFSYSQDMKTHFDKFKNHNAVKFFNSICLKPRMYNFTAPPTSMLYLDNCSNVRDDLQIDDFLMRRIAGPDSFKIFSEYLKDFSQVSGFKEKF